MKLILLKLLYFRIEFRLKAFSRHHPTALKIIIIDNAGFHSLAKYKIPDNIKLRV